MKKLFTLFILMQLSSLVRAQINAEFTWCPVYDTSIQTCCIQFEDLSFDSGGTITTYFWSTGDGGSSTIANPKWCYSVTGTCIVILIVYGPSGTDTVTHSLTINYLDTTECNCDSLIGVNEISAGDYFISVSPNPFHDKTKLSLHSDGIKKINDAEIKIYNSLGALMRIEKIDFDSRQEIILERKSLEQGLYYFIINTQSSNQAVCGKLLIE